MAQPVQYDVGLGHVADGIEKIYSYLDQQSRVDKYGRALSKTISGVNTNDPVVHQYLNAANDLTQTDPQASKVFLQKALERAGEIYDKDIAFMQNKPQVYSKFADDKTGRTDINSMTKYILKLKNDNSKAMKYLAGLNAEELFTIDKEGRKHIKPTAAMKVAQQESIFKGSFDPLSRMIKTLTQEGERTYRKTINTSNQPEKTAINVISKDISIAKNDIKASQGMIKDLMEQKGITYNKEERASIDTKIAAEKLKIDNLNKKVFGKYQERVELLQKLGVSTDRQKEFVKLVNAINRYKDTYGISEAAKRIDDALKAKGSSLEAYDIYIGVIPSSKPEPTETIPQSSLGGL